MDKWLADEHRFHKNVFKLSQKVLVNLFGNAAYTLFKKNASRNIVPPRSVSFLFSIFIIF